MDGRNLSPSIILKWTPLISLSSIVNTLPIFIKKVITASDYEFYGEFSINAVYELTNFNNMLVNNFPCRIDSRKDTKNSSLFNKDNSNFTLIISDDCLVLFKHIKLEGQDSKYGKIVFWSSLFSITDLQINKDKKVVRLIFYAHDKEEEQIRLNIENVLYFKETLIKKMSNLKIKIEIDKLVKGKYIENKITNRDINNMEIAQIEEYIKYFLQKLNSNIITYYIVDTFMILSGKAIEYYSKIKSDKQIQFLMQMQEVLQREKVKEVLSKNKENNSENENNNNNNEEEK